MSGLTIGSLFSGIGGLELGLEWAGLGPTLWQVEQDAYCRAVLAKHWPAARRFEDVRAVGVSELGAVDVLCGGFPCQDASKVSRSRAGIDGDKTGLWSEYARLIREIRPRYAVLENVPALLVRGFDRVLGDLAACGYDAEWQCLTAASVGAPHIRDRLFVVAYPGGGRHGAPQAPVFAGRTGALLHGRWRDEPAVARVADGLSHRLERRALGNAVVPQVAEVVGRMILAREQSLTESAA
jgi:DNA (cytosine-5)-methyltransferase 1